MDKPKFRIWATLIDSYEDYLNCDSIWEMYYGWSDSPKYTPEEFKKQKFQELIDNINRVPHESNEAADKGTAFNEILDCIVEHRNSDKMKITKRYKQIVEGSVETGTNKVDYADVYTTDEVVGVDVEFNNHKFFFPIGLVNDMSKVYKGGMAQKFISGVLPTAFGDVELYGFPDYIMPFNIRDLKTTSRYSAGKFKNHYQHLVYPYILNQNGDSIKDFYYDVVVWGSKDSYEIYNEYYAFEKERDIPRLTQKVEELIMFLNDNRDKITNMKIFNQE